MKLSDEFNGADLRNVCTEAGRSTSWLAYCVTLWVKCKWHLTGMFALRAEREYVVNEDFMKAVRKVSEGKKLETKLEYKQV